MIEQGVTNYIVLLATVIDIPIVWYSTVKEKEIVRSITKPLFCVLAMIYLYLSAPVFKFTIYFQVGMFFSMLGDIFLLGSGLKLFALGLVSFLCTHICYIIGYETTLENGLSALSVLVLIIATITAVPLMQHSKSSTQMIFTLPVHFYSCGLVGGNYVTALTLSPTAGVHWQRHSALLSLIGYSFFAISDAFIAWHTFVRKTKFSSFMVISTYHIAQMCLIMGIVTNKWD